MSKEIQKSIVGEDLTKEEEISLVYDGPSFDGRMELNKLTNQLNSTEMVLQETINILYKEKKLKNPEKTKLYLELKKGSFDETILITFAYPLLVSIVGGIIIEIVKTYASRKNKRNKEDKFVNNGIIVNNLNMIVNPLQHEKDRLIIKLPNGEETKISYDDKNIIKKNVLEFKEETKVIEYYEDEFTGFLNSVNVRQKRYGFILEGTKSNSIIPVTFDESINLEEIAKNLPEKIRINAHVKEENGEIKKMHILKHNIIRRKTLKEFGL